MALLAKLAHPLLRQRCQLGTAAIHMINLNQDQVGA